MPKQHRVLTTIELPTGEFENLPSSVLKSIRNQVSGSTASEKWMFLGVSSASDYKVLVSVAKAFIELSPGIRGKVSEDRISELLQFYLEGEERAEVDLAIERDNAALRATYIKETSCYTAIQIRSFQSGAVPQNPSYPAAGWKREKRVFAIPHGNSDLYPAFQFQDGEPVKALKKILKTLPSDMSPWQIAFWFATSNGWLDGKTRQECLHDNGAVLDAADRLNEVAIG